ncbi:MAG: hypothetical protein UT28_C0001G0438 [Berkelbacteria bacterium GW2011_GWE1_39_12]|uniref:Uncharacterized protein n=1 Tax=Berkelbacteria bacterium GW2011_GWE1_39_12 TaxID=1618337 RepID=A0A0G4B332_9BACT|nr:MAG: hypothetical protein UT28_C0001G0438 [Berkelbacteria bacterium GW2011_GWE1_39_12]
MVYSRGKYVKKLVVLSLEVLLVVLALLCAIVPTMAGGPDSQFNGVQLGFAQQVWGGWYAAEVSPQGIVVHQGQTILLEAWDTDSSKLETEWKPVFIDQGIFGSLWGFVTWTPTVVGKGQMYLFAKKHPSPADTISAVFEHDIVVAPAFDPSLKMFAQAFYNPGDYRYARIEVQIWNETINPTGIMFKLQDDGNGFFTIFARNTLGTVVSQYHVYVQQRDDITYTVSGIVVNGYRISNNTKSWRTVTTSQKKTNLPASVKIELSGGVY